MKLLGHPDPWILERELLRRIDSSHPGQGRAETLVLVPTTRLAAHVERRLATASARRAWLGVHVRTFRLTASGVLDRARQPAPGLLSERMRLALVRRVLEAQPENPWAVYVRRRPGAASRVAAAFHDLREAGIGAAELGAVEEADRASTALADLYAAYAAGLDAGHARGFTDEAGLVRAAIPWAAEFARAHGAVLLHGAYELLGIHVDLLHALDQGTEVTALVPARRATPATRYGVEFATRFLERGGVHLTPIEDAGDPGCGLALDALYDEPSRPAPAAPVRVSFRSCQGAHAEVESAVRHALAAIVDGCPPHEIAIVARSLGPYASAIESVLAEERIPFTSSVAAPLRQRPVVRDLLLLLRTVSEDFPRATTAELLRSPRVRWDALAPDGRPPEGQRADVWSRKARIVGGIDEWTVGLPRWAEEDSARRARARPDEPESGWRVDEAQRIGAALSRLRARVAPAPRTWTEQADRIHTIATELLSAAAADSARIDELLADMRRLESWLGDGRRVPFADALAWLDQAADATEELPHRDDAGGLRVLDALQARGLTFERVHLLGMNAGVFPRRGADDPVLGDALRLKLSEASGRPLPLTATRPDEERELLLLLLGGSRTSVEVSWQRAAEVGRVRSPSLALREIARIARGHPDLAEARPVEVPSHPERWLRYAIEGPRALTEAECVLLRALAGHGPGALADLARAQPALADGLRTVAATESFVLLDPAFDGRIGRSVVPADGLSVSAFETLGRCPLRFFFARVLRVHEAEDEVEALELEPRELGSEVHARLADLYRTLDDERLLDPARLDEALARAERLLDRSSGEILGSLGERMAKRFPVMWQHTASRWRAAILAFVQSDLRRLAGEGLSLAGLELPYERDLPLGPGATLTLRGRLDRVLRGPAGAIVSDYKTGRSAKRLEDGTSLTPMLKGLALQVPLYLHLVDGATEVELLGIHPAFEPGGARETFRGFVKPRTWEGFVETLRVLLDLLCRGSFPLRPSETCKICSFRAACRHDHPPTIVRDAADADGQTCAALGRKTERKPLFALVGHDDA